MNAGFAYVTRRAGHFASSSLVRYGVGFAALFALTFLSAATVTRGRVRAERPTTHARDRGWQGRQVVVVLIGSADCAHSRDPTTRRAFAEIVDGERRRANAAGARLVTIGVAVDQDVRVGLDALQSIATFDEVIAGGGLLNTGALRYAVRDFAGPPSVPQVLILSRLISQSSDSSVAAGPDSLQRRLIGTQEMARWAARLTIVGS